MQARHIVSDKLFTRAPGGRTQTCQRVPNAPSGGKSSPTGKVARMNTEVYDPTRAIGIIREIHSGTATERQDQEMEDVKTQLHLTPFFFILQQWNFCAECLSPGSVRNSVCLWPVIDNAAQADPPRSAECEPA